MSELYKLEFELPLKDIQDRIDSLKKNAINSGVDVSSTIKKLEDELVYKRQQIYENLTRWERVQLARHPSRPYSSDYISKITSFWFELHGDKLYADDPAILAGIAIIDTLKVVIIAQEKGRGKTQGKIAAAASFKAQAAGTRRVRVGSGAHLGAPVHHRMRHPLLQRGRVDRGGARGSAAPDARARRHPRRRQQHH